MRQTSRIVIGLPASRWTCAAIAGALGTGVLLPSAAFAVLSPIVRDTWQDSDRTAPASPSYSENGFDADADTDLESAWFNSGTGASLVATPGHLMMDIPASSASWTTYFTPEASPVTLGTTGDRIRTTWTFTTGDVNTTNTSQNFRIALVDSPSASRIAVDGTPGAGTYSGYAMFGNMGETTGNGNAFQLRERDGSNAALLSASSPPWTAVANGLGTGLAGYADNTSYTFVMDLTRNGSSLDILMSMTGGNIGGTGSVSVSFNDATPNGFTYDTFALRPSGDASNATFWDTTLFQVETDIAAVVPEPTALLGLGVGALAVLKRRR